MSSTQNLAISAALYGMVFNLQDEYLLAEKHMGIPELNKHLDTLFPEEGE
jgi:hypothetical protein